jgi:hypothetical protein
MWESAPRFAGAETETPRRISGRVANTRGELSQTSNVKFNAGRTRAGFSVNLTLAVVGNAASDGAESLAFARTECDTKEKRLTAEGRLT